MSSVSGWRLDNDNMATETMEVNDEMATRLRV